MVFPNDDSLESGFLHDGVSTEPEKKAAEICWTESCTEVDMVDMVGLGFRLEMIVATVPCRACRVGYVGDASEKDYAISHQVALLIPRGFCFCNGA